MIRFKQYIESVEDTEYFTIDDIRCIKRYPKNDNICTWIQLRKLGDSMVKNYPSNVKFSVPVDIQEYIIGKHPGLIGRISNLNSKVASRNSHLVMANKFGVFDED